MAFIGIITSKKNEEILKKAIEHSLNQSKLKLNIIPINDTNIENMKNIKFDTIIMQEENHIILNRQEVLKKILMKTQFLVLNSDIYNNLQIINQLKLTVITYGLNLKATVTASSLGDDTVCLSIQRAIKNIKGELIEPREVTLEAKNIDIYKLMINYIISILYT